MKRLLKFLKYLIKEFIPVLLGVLVALMINENREKTKFEKVRESNLAIIQQRAELNIARLESSIENHNMFVDVCSSTINDTTTIVDVINSIDGFLGVRIKPFSAQFLNSSMEDYELILKLDELELDRDALAKSQDIVLEMLYSNVEVPAKEVKSKVSANVMAFIHLEEELLEGNKRLLSYLQGRE